MSVGFYLRRAWVAFWYRLVFARLSGQGRIIKANLQKAYPDLGRVARWQLACRIRATQGRFIGEVLNFPQLVKEHPDARIEGPGKAALLQAVQEGKPVILLSGHIGNYALGLRFLAQMGVDVGFLYRMRGNLLLDARFEDMLAATGQQGFKIGHRSHKGYEANLKDFIEFLSSGHIAVMLGDHRDRNGERIRFLDRRAPTSLTPAKLALAHGALLIPCFVLREGCRSRFCARLEAPIRHRDPVAMMRDFNDHMTAIIRHDPTQWSWTIRRW